MDDDGMVMNWHFSTPVTSKPAVQKPKAATEKLVKATAAPAVKDSATTTLIKSATPDNARGKVRHGKAQVMSSLFSFNPEVKQPRNVIKKSRGSTIPSNAPMADASHFSGIGIDPDLVNLLQSKLHVTAPTQVQQQAIPLLLGPSRTVQACDIPEHDVDVVVQAETGSGKTLTYLLPIINRLVGASTFRDDAPGFGDRSIGTVAIILTPTRELAQQVVGVLNQLVNLGRPASPDTRRTHWIVPGIAIGGDSKAKEKARLRKGVSVLVSTPGRLLDHLDNTKSFDTRHLRWLVLDEADRLLDLGFEETLKKIMAALNMRSKQPPAPQFREALQTPFWPQQRQTILCSATLRDDVKDLAGWSLVNPAFVSASRKGTALDGHSDDDESSSYFSTPSQLKQTYIITPAKLRLVTLVTMLRTQLEKKQKTNSKAIVFFSSCDSVDFHFDLFSHTRLDYSAGYESDDERGLLKEILSGGGTTKDAKATKTKPWQQSEILGNAQLFRLHGDLGQAIRTDTFQAFSQATSGVLLCTDVAARGLDLPHVDHIVQYDPPTDLKDYVHRVGRTARLGKAGEATLFLLPSEDEYLDILKAQGLVTDPISTEDILSTLVRNGRGDYREEAQKIHNAMEGYVLAAKEHISLARKAYLSSVRAYATHTAAEKHIFHVKKLHLGHLAKAFALREAPSDLQETTVAKKKVKETKTVAKKQQQRKAMKRSFDHTMEFAIASADNLSRGPTTKRKRQR